MMKLAPLKDVILPKPEAPETTLSLIRAVRDPERTLKDYRFTDSIRRYFETILEAVAQGTGQGFWIPAEYGAGKTHFLAALACMLSDTSERLWSEISDPEIARYRKRLGDMRLFPVLVSLRGESGVPDELVGRQLFEILESAIERQLEETGLRDEISITTADEIYQWYTSQSADLRSVIDEHVRSQTGMTADEYLSQEGVEALARLVRQYAEAHRIRPVITFSTKDRMVSICRQLEAAGYQGVLFIVDEFAFWQDRHPEGSPEYAHDEDVLETLGWVLPRDYSLPVYTVVASQKPSPTKLVGDRFHELRLLGEPEKHEYEIIVCWRVRDLVEEKLPEINQYYDYYSKEFRFMQHVSRQLFGEIFPFQPRCFEVMRLVTQRQLPTVRLGIYAMWEVLSSPSVLERDGLVTVSDLLQSRQLEKALHMASFERAYDAYLAAGRALDSLGVSDEEVASADRLVKTLFLWHAANLDSPRPLSAHDLAEATLMTSEHIEKEDEVALLLKQLDDLPQVSYSKDKGASFHVTESEQGPAQILEGLKRGITNTFDIQKNWEGSLCWTTTETASADTGLFHDLGFGETKRRKAEHRRVEYTGEVVLDHTWRPDYGEIRKEDVHFRIVVLTRPQVVAIEDLQDRRVAVCIPADLSSMAEEAIREYMALGDMTKRYQGRVGPEAEAVRNWLKAKRPELVTDVVGKQLQQYLAGGIVTRGKLAIDPREIFASRQNDPRVRKIADVLLGDAYTALPIKSNALKKALKDQDTAKLIAGLLQGDESSAATSAADNFSVALGLSKPSNPRRFDPEGCDIMDYLAGQMRDRDGEVHLWQTYEALGREPWGLTSSLISLYILAFVRKGDPIVEIRLRPDHKFKLRSGGSLPQDTIKASTIFDLEWRSGLERHLSAATLAMSAGPAWNDVCRSARVIAPTVRPATDPAQIKEQEQALVAGLKRLNADALRARANLQLLGKRLEQLVAPEDDELLGRIAAISEAENYLSLHERLVEAHYDLESLGKDFSQYKQLASVSEISTEVVEAKAWLDAVALSPEHRDLAIDRVSILNQISLASLVENAQLWPSIKQQYTRFKEQYRSAYQIHHREYHRETVNLSAKLAEAEKKLDALQQLNTVPELGAALGEDLKAARDELLTKLSACPITVVTDVNVESSPTCSQCSLQMTDTPPTEEVHALLGELQAALDGQLRRLGNEAIRGILAESSKNNVKKLVEIVQAADLSSLVNVMDHELVKFVRELLRESRIRTEESTLLDDLARRFPTVEQEDVPEVVSELEGLLQRAFEVARKKYPDGKIRISLK